MDQNQLKQQAAEAALKYVKPNSILGVGTGSTTNAFIEAMARAEIPLKGAVASSEATKALLQKYNYNVIELNESGPLDLYIDGADEVDPHLNLIKGGGGALTREKIIAEASEQFICLVDASKQVPVLGEFPLPVEVIPMARSLVGRKIFALGADPEYRTGFQTDNGNIIIDINGLKIAEPLQLEESLNHIPGVVTNGLFARRGADLLIVGSDKGPQEIQSKFSRM